VAVERVEQAAQELKLPEVEAVAAAV